MQLRTRNTLIVESLADSLLAEHARRRAGGAPGGWARYAGVQDPGVAAAYDVQVAALLHNAPWLKQALKAAARVDEEGRASPAARDRLVSRLHQELRHEQRQVRRSLEALLGADERGPRADEMGVEATSPAVPRQRVPGGRARDLGRRDARAAEGRRGAFRGRVMVPLTLLDATIVLALATGPLLHLVFGTPLPQQDGRVVALSVVAVWALSFLPGWLFVRFLDRRAGSLWDEYVIHLHRLGLDEPGNLPEPPRSSGYHQAWAADGGAARRWLRNIYREKFDAYYGRSVSRFGTDVDRPVRPEALFPIFLTTAVLATGWTAILYDPTATVGAIADPHVGTMLSFGFMGAYVFFLQVLLRRYFQADLRAGAYVSGHIRTVSALLIVVVLHAALPQQTPAGLLIATAFLVGWFPDIGLQWLSRFVSRRLRAVVPSVEASHPLNRLDGLSVWYEFRLLEEGIEDLQNLVTAKLVDVMLHTRVPVARMVDWVDQALLLIHLPAEPAVADQQGHTFKGRSLRAAGQADGHPRQLLRACGIRSATGLLRALGAEADPRTRKALLVHLESEGLPTAALLSLRDVLAGDHRLGVVYNWQDGDAGARIAPAPPQPAAL